MPPHNHRAFATGNTNVQPVPDRHRLEACAPSVGYGQDACDPSRGHGQDACDPSGENGQDDGAPSAYVPSLSPAPRAFMRPFDNVAIHVRNLPHWQQDNTLVFVTWRLADSLPQTKLLEIEETQRTFLSSHPEPWDDATRLLHRKHVSLECEAFLDTGHGACFLQAEQMRDSVESALHHFDGTRYRLHAFVVMPNHVHVLFEALPGHPQDKILHTWKSYSANVINEALSRQGPLWQDESWDRLIRNEAHYRNCVQYIQSNNPRIARVLCALETLTSAPSGGHRQDACAPSQAQLPIKGTP